MRTLGIWLLLFALALPVAGEDPRVGDPVSRVRELLGEPSGYLRVDTLEAFTYARGRVEARDGIVRVVELVSPEVLLARQAEEARRRVAAAEAAVALREAQKVEGAAVLARVLADPAFQVLRGVDQLAYWEWFQKRYPDVPPGAELAVARARAAREIQEAEAARAVAAREAAALQAREDAVRADMRELEARVELAERTARDAEERARRRETVYYTAPPVVFSPYPVTTTWCSPYDPRRPAVTPPPTPQPRFPQAPSVTRPFVYDRSFPFPYDRHYVTPDGQRKYVDWRVNP